MPIEPPFDHNAECRYCDEQAGHAADCSWLVALEQQAQRQEEELVKANEKVETLRRKVEHYEQAHGLPDVCCPD